MKKLLFVLSLILFLWAPAFAQSDHNHGLFSSRNQQNDNSPSRDHPGGTTPGGGGNESPIGSGLLVLTGLSIGYACFKQSRKEDGKIFEYYKMGWFTISIFLYFQKFFIDNKINIIKHFNV